VILSFTVIFKSIYLLFIGTQLLIILVSVVEVAACYHGNSRHSAGT